MGTLTCCNIESPYTAEGFAVEEKITLYGDVIQAETRCILMLLTMSKISYEFVEVDMLNGDHMSD
jgi:hypothetical protein